MAPATQPNLLLSEKCFSYRIGVAVLATVLGTILITLGLVALRWWLKKRKFRKMNKENGGMITIGRKNKFSSKNTNYNMCNNNARPNLSTLRDTTACPVVVPSIQITANADDRTDTDVTYAEIRRLRSQPSLRRAAISGQSRSSSKGSGEYVDLTEKLASSVVKPSPHPINSSTPVTPTTKPGGTVATEATYVTPVQYDKNKQDGTTNRTGNDSTEVFDSAHHIFRVRTRITSAFRMLSGRISSTVSALGNPSTTALAPVNSQNIACESQNGIYLSFDDASVSNNPSPSLKILGEQKIIEGQKRVSVRNMRFSRKLMQVVRNETCCGNNLSEHRV